MLYYLRVASLGRDTATTVSLSLSLRNVLHSPKSRDADAERGGARLSDERAARSLTRSFARALL